MKKASLVIVLIIAIIFNAFQHVYAYDANFLPGGKNYISKSNLIYTTANSDLTTLSPFVVKPETTYTLSFPQMLFSPSFEIEMLAYENDVNVGSLMISETDFNIEEIGGVMTATYTFETDHQTNYFEIGFYAVDMSDGDPIPNIQLEEGQVATTYEDYIEGSMIDTTSPYFQSSGTIISYVDQPITAMEIQNSLSAYDKVDGDVSTNITLVSDDYTPYMDTLGTYSITFSVSDSSGNTSEIIIGVEVVDVLAPVFSDVPEITVIYPNQYTTLEIIQMLSASDNYDGDISSSITMVSDGYTDNASTIGTYPMQFQVSDASGNIATHDLNIHVVDQEAPIISGEELLVIGYNQYYSEASMLSSLTVSDNYDTNLSVVIESNGYKNNHDVIGEYTVLFSSTDSSGNYTEKTLTIQVVDEIGPMIYLDLSVIQVYSDTVMSLPDFAELLTKSNELDQAEDYLITIKYDSYSAHAREPGTYHLHLQFEDSDGEIINKDLQINVIDKGLDGVLFGEENIDIGFIQKYKDTLIYGGVGLVFVMMNLGWYLYSRKNH